MFLKVVVLHCSNTLLFTEAICNFHAALFEMLHNITMISFVRQEISSNPIYNGAKAFRILGYVPYS